MGGIETVLAIGLGALTGGDAAAAMAKLAVGTPEQRRDAEKVSKIPDTGHTSSGLTTGTPSMATLL